VKYYLVINGLGRMICLVVIF